MQNDTPEIDSITTLALQPHGDIQKTPTSDSCLTCHGEKLAEPISTIAPPGERRAYHLCRIVINPHQPMGKEIQKKVCLTCHAEQKGPMRYEHGAISGNLTDACLDCHRPHGSPNQRLLKITNRGLCLQCHGDKASHFIVAKLSQLP